MAPTIVSDRVAPFEAPYRPPRANPYSATPETVLMIRPPGRSPRWASCRQWAHAWWVSANVPLKLIDISSSNAASSVSEMSSQTRIPALFTTTSRRPSSSTVRCTSAPIASQSATEAVSTTARPPAARISSATACAELAPVPPTRLLTTTVAPSAASASACARPSPVPAPVTIATLPSSSPTLFTSLVVVHQAHTDLAERSTAHRFKRLLDLTEAVYSPDRRPHAPFRRRPDVRRLDPVEALRIGGADRRRGATAIGQHHPGQRGERRRITGDDVDQRVEARPC